VRKVEGEAPAEIKADLTKLAGFLDKASINGVDAVDSTTTNAAEAASSRIGTWEDSTVDLHRNCIVGIPKVQDTPDAAPTWKPRHTNRRYLDALAGATPNGEAVPGLRPLVPTPNQPWPPRNPLQSNAGRAPVGSCGVVHQRR